MAKASSKTVKNTVPVTPLGDRVLLRDLTDEERERKLSSGLILPASVKDDKGSTKKGKVIAVGAGKFEDGQHRPLQVKVGDTVLFSWGDQLKLEDEDYHLVTESNILGILN